MIKLFLLRIKNGAMTLDEVPKLWHSNVRKELEQLEKF